MKMETLHLDNNLLNGEIPLWLFDMKGLKHLFIGSNNLTWNNKAKMVPTCMVYELNMRSCGLAVEIPNWISTQKTLGTLDLSENQLEGMFPQWLIEMDVADIFLLGNNLTGSLPSCLFNSKNLSFLFLSRNNFYGELPNNIGNASGIIILMLDGNKFSGKVPESISNMYSLSLLDLSDNKFSSDTLPDFSSFNFLEITDLSSNEFSGEIQQAFPKKLKFSHWERISFLGTCLEILLI